MHFSTLSTLLFASLITASPVTTGSQSAPFHVKFGVDAGETTLLAARVVYDIKTDSTLIVGQKTYSDNGTLAHFASQSASIHPSPNSTIESDLALIFTTNSTSFGAIVPNIGDAEGSDFAIAARKGMKQFQWSVDTSSGQLYHTLYSGDNLFLACRFDVNGEEVYILSFGEADQTGMLPKGCEATKVVQSAAGVV